MRKLASDMTLRGIGCATHYVLLLGHIEGHTLQQQESVIDLTKLLSKLLVAG